MFNDVLILIAIVAVVWVVVHAWRTHKEPRCPDVSLFTGGVKCGKTTTSLYMAMRMYRRNVFKWKVKCYLCSKFYKPYPEMPLFYSNIPVKIPHVPLTTDIILRKERPAFKSVCFVDEASLLADSFDFADKDVNEEIKLFNKLWGHETHGGALVYNTQNESDLHFNIKRCLGSYIWIHRTIKWIPFFLVIKCREMVYSEGTNAVNVFNEDVEDSLKWIICSKRIWKKFDCYCYSHYTDRLPVKADVVGKPTSMKADVVSFKPYTHLRKENSDVQEILHKVQGASTEKPKQKRLEACQSRDGSSLRLRNSTKH